VKRLSSGRGSASGDRGSQIAEAAVVLPITFLLLFAIYWFGRAFNVYATINHAAREGAQSAAIPACGNCTASCSWQGTALPCDTQVATVVNNALLAAHLDPALAIPTTPVPAPQLCPGANPAGACAAAAGGGFTLCRHVLLNQGASSPPVCGVIVSFQYPYQGVLPFTSLNRQTILLNAQVEMRVEE
jgi:hypothetical protein